MTPREDHPKPVTLPISKRHIHDVLGGFLRICPTGPMHGCFYATDMSCCLLLRTCIFADTLVAMLGKCYKVLRWSDLPAELHTGQIHSIK